MGNQLGAKIEGAEGQDMTKILASEDGRQVLFFEENKPLSQMIAGVIIACKRCKRQELVVKGSFCDVLKLCIEHARDELKSRGII